MRAGDPIALVAITELALCDGDDLIARVTAMATAVPPGALAVQLRAGALAGGGLWRRAERLRAATAAAGATLWINDRLDVALAVGADGVHLPEAGLAVATARALAPNLAVAVSRHDPATALDADRIQLGPIWPTPSKAGLGAPLGPGALAALRARWAGAVVAVGGVDGPDRARAAAAAGADAVAAIRALWQADDPGAIARTLVAAVLAGRRDRAK